MWERIEDGVVLPSCLLAHRADSDRGAEASRVARSRLMCTDPQPHRAAPCRHLAQVMSFVHGHHRNGEIADPGEALAITGWRRLPHPHGIRRLHRSSHTLVLRAELLEKLFLTRVDGDISSGD